MYRKIFKLLGELSSNLIKLQKVNFKELKETVDIIDEEYGEFDIEVNLVNIKPSIEIIDEIRNELSHNGNVLRHIYLNMVFLMENGHSATIEKDFEDSIPYDGDIKLQVNNLGEELKRLKLI